MLKDIHHLKELFQRLDEENKQKAKIIENSARQIAYIGKVKNKAIRKYRGAKQQLQSYKDSSTSISAELEESRTEMTQLLAIVKKQEMRLEEYKVTMENKANEVN